MRGAKRIGSVSCNGDEPDIQSGVFEIQVA